MHMLKVEHASNYIQELSLKQSKTYWWTSVDHNSHALEVLIEGVVEVDIDLTSAYDQVVGSWLHKVH